MGYQKPENEEVQTIQRPKEKGQKDESTTHYIENEILGNMNPTKNRWCTQVLRIGLTVAAPLVTPINNTNTISHGNRVEHQYT